MDLSQIKVENEQMDLSQIKVENEQLDLSQIKVENEQLDLSQIKVENEQLDLSQIKVENEQLDLSQIKVENEQLDLSQIKVENEQLDLSQIKVENEMGPEQAPGSIFTCKVHRQQGDRVYRTSQEINSSQDEPDENDYEISNFSWTFGGLFDGHGGCQAASYAQKNLMNHIVSHPHFNSDEDDLVLQAITEGFISLQNEMAEKRNGWPKSIGGRSSVSGTTASGTTASVAFVKNKKVYLGHVGDSAIVLGFQDPANSSQPWTGKQLTVNHLADSPAELHRIENCGGHVIRTRKGARITWNKPKGEREQVPFIQLARSLGDFWSLNPDKKEYLVSPVPDTMVFPLDLNIHRCLILGSGELWKLMPIQNSVNVVYSAEMNNSRRIKAAEKRNETSETQTPRMMNLLDPVARLVKRALDERTFKKVHAENVSAEVIMFR